MNTSTPHALKLTPYTRDCLDKSWNWLRDPEAAIALRPRFRALHETLRRDASRRAADAVAELLPR